MKALKVLGILAMFLNPLLAEAAFQRDGGPGLVERVGMSIATKSNNPQAPLAHVVIGRVGGTAGWYYAPTSNCPSSTFYFDVSTDKGKALLAMLLFAKSTGKQVSYLGFSTETIAGGTNCVLEEINVN